MLFRRNMEPQCAYCRFGTRLGSGAVGCLKRGVVSEFSSCRTFKYDPYSRKPELPQRIPLRSLPDKEFSLVDFNL